MAEGSTVKNLFVTYRRPLVVLVHVALWTISTVGAFLLRFDFDVPSEYWTRVPSWLALMLALRSASYAYFGLFHGLWRYSGTKDLADILKASLLSSGLFAGLALFAWSKGVPRSVIVIDFLASVLAVGGLRFGIRTVRELGLRHGTDAATRRRVLVVGAGDAGEMLVREMLRIHGAGTFPLASSTKIRTSTARSSTACPCSAGSKPWATSCARATCRRSSSRSPRRAGRRSGASSTPARRPASRSGRSPVWTG